MTFSAVAGPGRAAKRALEWLVIGERRGLETAGTVQLDQLGIAAPDRVEYTPSPWTSLVRGLRGCRIGPKDAFVDFGSGKGRIVFLAARYYRFGRVTGVELSSELTNIARANIEASRRRLRCPNVELVTCDATRYAIPEDMTYAYFANPFTGRPFAQVIDNIVESLDQAPRRITLIYASPDRRFSAPAACEAYIVGTGRFRLVRQSTGLRRRTRVSVYTSERSVGAGGATEHRS